jgi:predicted MPP superfamily phosphohydrolase
MSIFLLIVIGLPVLDLAWWYLADRRLRGLPRARRWRLLLAAFVGGNLAVYGWLLLSRLGGYATAVPTVLLGVCYIWHLFVLPATVLAVLGVGLLRAVRAAVARLSRASRALRSTLPTADAVADPDQSAAVGAGSPVTRRHVLAAALVAVPPVATGLGQVRALSQLERFRLRRLEVHLPTLPPALDGLTIAHVSDLHVGRFTNGPILDEVVTRTNALGADLVLFSGDLIDHALADLPAGLDVLQRLRPPERLFVCEGNHDLFEGRAAFEERVRAAGIRLLLNETALAEVRGGSVQILGLRWGQPGGGRGARLDEQLDRLLPLRQAGVFTILLAHHPHAFDRAARAGIPLTLAGHTHGGQLMWSDDLGAGSVLFKYCSGLYRQGPSALVVSNGVGNWFPLRINAPAEILHVTLHTALPSSGTLPADVRRTR